MPLLALPRLDPPSKGARTFRLPLPPPLLSVPLPDPHSPLRQSLGSMLQMRKLRFRGAEGHVAEVTVDGVGGAGSCLTPEPVAFLSAQLSPPGGAATSPGGAATSPRGCRSRSLVLRSCYFLGIRTRRPGNSNVPASL